MERSDSVFRAGELRQKEVINICNGERLGYVCDVEFCLEKGEIEAIVVPGCMRLFRFGKKEDIVITWDKIRCIGDDVILVELSHFAPKKKACD